MCREPATVPGIRPCADESALPGDAAGVGAPRTAGTDARSRDDGRQRRKERRRQRYAEDHDYREKMRAQTRASYQAHKDTINARRRERYASQPENRAMRGPDSPYWRRINRTYGLSLEQFDALFVRQGGVCAICHRRPKGDLCVDHCHRTGRVRGLLCRSCNMVLGLYRDDPNLMRAATAYLEVAAGAALTQSQQGMELNMATDGAPPDGGKAGRLIRHALIVALYRHRDSEDGRKSQKLRLIADTLVDKAVDGDMQAIKEILDRVDGRPGAAATPEDGPRKVTFAWKDYQYPWTTSPNDNSSPSTSDGSASPAS
jgi:Recombination endonuclease VII